MNDQHAKYGIAASAIVGATDSSIQVALHNGETMKLAEVHRNGQSWVPTYVAPKPKGLGRGFFITRHQKHWLEMQHAHGWRICGTQNGPMAPTFPWDESINSGFSEKEFRL